ncbi:MAG: redoxin family protein [Bacteroidia bacterium]
MKKLFYLLSSIIILGSCQNKNTKDESGFVVNGTIKNASNTQISLQEITTTGLILLDTTTIAADGSFKLNGTLTEKTFCTIRLPQGDIVLLVDTASRLTIEADASNLQEYTVAGSQENEDLRRLFVLNTGFMKAAQNIENRFSINQDEVPSIEVQNKIREAFDSLQQAHQTAIKDFAKSITSSLVPYFATNFLLPESDYAYLKLIDDMLYPTFNNSKYASALHTRVLDLKKTAIGEEAPEIVLSDPFGKMVSLSSLRGKVVLIDFWASWCGPCRRENPNVVKVYNKYKNKGFDILGVSLDDNRDAWIKAINDDKLLWNHVSDLMKWNSSVVKLYNIEGIPLTVLVDRDGKIIDKNLRGEALDKKLAEIFSK